MIILDNTSPRYSKIIQGHFTVLIEVFNFFGIHLRLHRSLAMSTAQSLSWFSASGKLRNFRGKSPKKMMEKSFPICLPRFLGDFTVLSRGFFVGVAILRKIIRHKILILSPESQRTQPGEDTETSRHGRQ